MVTMSLSWGEVGTEERQDRWLFVEQGCSVSSLHLKRACAHAILWEYTYAPSIYSPMLGLKFSLSCFVMAFSLPCPLYPYPLLVGCLFLGFILFCFLGLVESSLALQVVWNS